MTYPHFTIVIPTRNRLDTLKHAIRTCLEQDYDNFSIIVASNNCTDGTDDYVTSLGDSRIVQLVSKTDLRMTDNWSRVMPEAIRCGGYVTYLGDDDGLVPGALKFAAAIVRRFDCKVINWRKVEYAWPNVIVEEYKNYFSMSFDRTIVVKDAREFLRGAHEYQVGYDEGPGLYSSFVHTSVLASLLPVDGSEWFSACSPDIYSCYAIASAVPDYIKCRFGLSVNGASGKSNGTSYMHRPDSEMAAAFRGENKMHRALSHAPSIFIAEADGLLVARDRFPELFSDYQFSWSMLVTRLVDDLKKAPSRLHYDLVLAALRKIIDFSQQPSPELPDFVQNSNGGPSGPVPLVDADAKRITTMIDDHLAANVFDAAIFANSILPLPRLTVDDMSVIPLPIVHEAGENAVTQNATVPTVHTASSNPIKRLGRPVVRRVRKYRRWLNNADRIESWFAREAEIGKWIENDAIVNAAIQIHENRLVKEETARSEFQHFRRLAEQFPERGLKVDWDDRYLCLDDKTQLTGFDRHYIYHPAWAARVLANVRPRRHTDFSSTLHFCSLVSAFIPVDFYDYRPAPLQLTGLNSLGADLLSLPFQDNSLESVSCMHVLEHVGLGRYGDPIDPNGDIKAIRELCRVLAPGGSLLIAVPVGEARVQFNAHRVYRHRDFISYFEGLDLVEFALIPDGDVPNGLIYAAPEHLVDVQKYGCGCYWFKKSA